MQSRSEPTLSDWFGTPAGRYVLGWEQSTLDRLLADIFGYFAVQVGCPEIDFLRANRIPWRSSLALAGNARIIADAHELPFAAQSLDLLVLPHLLECSTEPHQILREAERVLRPEGELIVTGFNPLSLWGIRRMFARTQPPPWNAEFLTVLRVKDWLKLLNFELRGGRFGLYKPPFESEKWLQRLDFLESAGQSWWPVAGAVYVMQAKKRVAGARVLTPSWRHDAKAARAFRPAANKTNRTSRENRT